MHASETGAFLGEVEAGLAGLLEKAEPDTLLQAARHLCVAGGGKRARPLLVRWFGELAGAPEAALVRVAIAAELIHSASLLHDDVVDAGMFRRGRPTVNARWGNIVAVMTGDLLLARALRALDGLDARITHGAVATVEEMTRAAIAEVEARGDLDLPLAALREVALGKTGALFGWCGQAAGWAGGDEVAAQRLCEFGRRLGVAFQMADDVRDVTGVEAGKPRFADLHSRTPSLPVLIAARKDAGVKRRIQDAWAYAAMTPDRVTELGAAVLCTGAADDAQALIDAEIEAALAALGPYAATPIGKELAGWTRKLSEHLRARTDA